MNKSNSSNSKGYWRVPLDREKVSRIRGEVTILEVLCKECNFCIEFCPAEVLVQSEKINAKGYHPPEVKYPEECTGCGFCERVCPEFAIISEKIREEVTK